FQNGRRRSGKLAAADLRKSARLRRCAGRRAEMSEAAVVNYASKKHSVELRDVPRPTIGPDDVLLEVAAVGVCGSDLHQWTGDHSWPVNYPVVLAHEFAGHVRQVGARVVGWHVCDRGVSETAAVTRTNNPLSKQLPVNRYPTH